MGFFSFKNSNSLPLSLTHSLPTLSLNSTATASASIPPPPQSTMLIHLLFLTSLIAAAHSHNATKQPLNLKPITSFNPQIPPRGISASKRFEGSSNLVNLRYHMGPVLSSPINLYLIWYGRWPPSHRLLIKDFLLSISDPSSPSPSVSQWWRTLSLYSDQTAANVSRSLLIAGEFSDHRYSHGKSLTRLSIQSIIAATASSGASTVAAATTPTTGGAGSFAVDHRSGAFLVLTASDVAMQEFCRAVCGFHYFTFPSEVGYTLPYAWVGNSGAQCPEVCAYPFAVPGYMAGGGPGALRPPNGDAGVDGMISVIAHELAELSSNPLVNAWYAGEDPTAPTEIGDLCEGLYGSGGGGGYMGEVMRDSGGRTFNLNGRNGRKFLVQWVWSPVLKACVGPNAVN